MLRPLTADEVRFQLDCIPDDTPIEGNASAFDDETDARIVSEIKEELSGGCTWAWSIVRVRANWREYAGDDFLSGCSYASEDEFRVPGGYFEDMKARALDELNGQLARHAENLKPLLVSYK